jgi:hypothetical protein
MKHICINIIRFSLLSGSLITTSSGMEIFRIEHLIEGLRKFSISNPANREDEASIYLKTIESAPAAWTPQKAQMQMSIRDSWNPKVYFMSLGVSTPSFFQEQAFFDLKNYPLNVHFPTLSQINDLVNLIYIRTTYLTDDEIEAFLDRLESQPIS